MRPRSHASLGSLLLMLTCAGASFYVVYIELEIVNTLILGSLYRVSSFVVFCLRFTFCGCRRPRSQVREMPISLLFCSAAAAEPVLLWARCCFRPSTFDVSVSRATGVRRLSFVVVRAQRTRTTGGDDVEVVRLLGHPVCSFGWHRPEGANSHTVQTLAGEDPERLGPRLN